MKIIQILLFILFGSFNTFANDVGTMPHLDTGTVLPVENDNIQMVSEEINYYGRMYSPIGRFETTFEFLNTSQKSQEVTISFPIIGDSLLFSNFIELWMEEILAEGPEAIIKEMYRFESYIDGVKVERKLVKAAVDFIIDNCDYYFSIPVKFKPGERKIIKNIYQQRSSYEANSTFEQGTLYKYVLESGRFWKGNIESSKINFYFERYDSSYYFKSYETAFLPLINDININIALSPHILSFGDEYRFDLAKDYIKSGNKDPEIFSISSLGDAYLILFDAFPNPMDVYIEDNYIVFSWEFKNFEPDFNISILFLENVDSQGLWQSSYLSKLDCYGFESLFFRENEELYNTLIKSGILDDYGMFYKLNMRIALALMHYYPLNKINSYTPEELDYIYGTCRLIINSFYALKNKKFKSDFWKNLYSEFDWYQPLNNEVVFNENEQKALQVIRDYEKKIINEKEHPDVDNFIDADDINEAFIHAANEGDFAEVKRLLKQGVDVNYQGINGRPTALLYAVEGGHLEICKILLAAGADVNYNKAYSLWPPLSWASRKGYTEIAVLLIKYGADVNIKRGGSAPRYPLIFSAAKKNMELCRLLVENGADVNVQDYQGDTALLMALQAKKAETARYLIASGADITINNKAGKGALYYAAEWGDIEICKILIAEGADVNIMYHYQTTALSMAEKKGHNNVVQLLKESGAVR